MTWQGVGDRDAAACHPRLSVSISWWTWQATPSMPDWGSCDIVRRRSRSAIWSIPERLELTFWTTSSPIKSVLPFDQQPFYSEKIVHVPDCYQVNDRKRVIPAGRLSRSDAGLPPQGFVFCCFNNNYKISEPVFDVWMRLLNSEPASVLWLLSDNIGARDNLRREAAARGVDPARLIFAERCGQRSILPASAWPIFLDTPGCNAHTTASDALWMGLPVLTCIGSTFAGRVAASLLNAVGLADLGDANPRRIRSARAQAGPRAGAAGRASGNGWSTTG